MRRKLAAGNWKMNGLKAALAETDSLSMRHPTSSVDILICPPATLLAALSDSAGAAIQTGGQDCHANVNGAHTGDTSAQMLSDAGASYVILGHSERRADHAEQNAGIRAKVSAAWDAGLVAIVCVGETAQQRDDDQTLDVISKQLEASVPSGAKANTLVVAYEPVWAIGTGRTAETDDISEVHDFMRARLAKRFGAATADGIRLLYGGSVKPSNAPGIFAIVNVDGALVGGASLKAQDFSGIVRALEASQTT
jgi:triosephosphate isomerase